MQTSINTQAVKPVFRERIVSARNVAAVKILMYHRIVTDAAHAKKHMFCVHADDFRRQLEWFDHGGFTPITFEDYRLIRDDRLVCPRKPVIITFDDGYADSYENAFPLLKEYGMKAVFFVLGDRSVKCNYWDDEKHGLTAPLMEDRQILEMSESGMEIGAHSMSHSNLTEVDDRTAWHEISRSRILLEILLNKPVRTFSYPYGMVNDSVKATVRQSGYAQACSVWSGPVRFGTDDFELRRISVFNTTTTVDLMVKLSAPFQYYSWVRSKLRSIVRRGDVHGGVPPGRRELPVHEVQGKINIAEKI